MKKIIFFALASILLLNIVIAAENKVFVVNFNYKDGDVTLKDMVIKTGYYPDGKIQPEKGYTLELISDNNQILYSFKFEVPLKIYTDVINEKEDVEGGIIILTETDFALVLPYYKEAKQIKIYDKSDKEILSASVVPALAERSTLKWVFGFILIFIVLFFLLHEKKSKLIKHGR